MLAVLATVLLGMPASNLGEQGTELKVESLDLTAIRQFAGSPKAGRQVVSGEAFETGVLTQAPSFLEVDLGGRGERFKARVGVDDAAGAGKGSVEFIVWADKKELWRSGVMRQGDVARAIDLPMSGVSRAFLQVDEASDGTEGDLAVWGEATLTLARGNARTVRQSVERAHVLTPRPGALPKLTGPRTIGTRPGKPIHHTITATGRLPFEFSARGLPPGVTIDTQSGQLLGAVGFPGSFQAAVTVTNREGSDSRPLRIVAGETLALTPPLGWLGADPAANAAAMADRLARHGWNLVESHEVGPVIDEIHRLGLKAGLVANEPIPGIDALRTTDPTNLAEKLRSADRNVVLLGAKLATAEESPWASGANSWIVGESAANWPELMKTWRQIDGWAVHAKPGQWNDFGPLGIGKPGFSPSELYSQVTLWALVAAPLRAETPLTGLDDFSFGLLTNDEVLDVHQDPLGTPGRLTFAVGNFEVWSRSLEDLSIAIAVFNKGEFEADGTLDFGDPAVRGGIRLRDLWRQEPRGMRGNKLGITVPRHGVLFLRTNKFADFRFRLGHDPRPKPTGGGGK